MLTSRVSNVLVVMVLAAFSMLNVCCSGPKVGKYNLVVTPDASLKSSAGKLPDTNVWLVGVPKADVQTWRDYKVASLVSGSNQSMKAAMDSGQAMAHTFTNADQAPWKVAKTDAHWKNWQAQNATLFVFVNSNGLQNVAGGPELRRKEVSLLTDDWKSDTILIDINSGGINVHPPVENAK